MYLDIRIPLPAYGRLTRQRIRGVTYINYEYDRVYDKERRFNIPRRATIGKLDSNGMLIPNENYRKYFPGENLPGEKPRPFRSSCLRIGSFLLIRKLSEDYGLPRILGDFFSPRDLGLFLDLAAYSLVCEDNAAQYYPVVGEHRPMRNVLRHLETATQQNIWQFPHFRPQTYQTLLGMGRPTR